MEKHSVHLISVLLFTLLILMGILINLVEPDRYFSEKENRILAQKPKMTKATVLDGSWMKNYEEYLSDQFPGRDQWIGLKSRIERLAGKKDINGVYFGDGGYLLERFTSENVDSAQVEKNIECLNEFIENSAEVLGEGHVRMMLIPSASEILKDKLPSFAWGFDQSKVWKAFAPSPSFVNISEVLSSHNQEYIYYRTDHHWTTLGAFYAYQAWAKSLGITPFERTDFDEVVVSKDFFGTVYSKVNTGGKADEITLFQPKKTNACTLNYNLGEKTRDSLYDMAQLKGTDKYRVFLSNNSGIIQIEGSRPEEGLRLLVIKDSYANCFVPFLMEHYKNVDVIDLRYYNGNVNQYMKENHVTDVLVLYSVMNFVKDTNIYKLR